MVFVDVVDEECGRDKQQMCIRDRYYSIGGEYVIGEKVGNCPKLIRLKAAEENFSGETTLSVVTRSLIHIWLPVVPSDAGAAGDVPAVQPQREPGGFL